MEDIVNDENSIHVCVWVVNLHRMSWSPLVEQRGYVDFSEHIS